MAERQPKMWGSALPTPFWRVALALPFGIAALSTIHAQPQTPFRAGVNFVRVDAIPTDKTGAFIANLTQDDFEVTELGKPQTIETFDKVVLDGGLMSREPPPEIRDEDDERREAARADVRLFGMFLDDYHISRVSSLQTRDTLARFIATDLGPSDLVELMTPMTPLSALLLTRDHDAVESRIERFLGRRGEYEPPQNAAEENLIRRYGNNPAMLDTVRDQVALTALEGFIAHFAACKEARKTLILVTEGFTRGLGELDLQELYTDANRGNISIYWIDPRRLEALLRGDGQEGLRALALYTDGRTLITNDLLASMKQIVSDMSGYYLLGYTSTLDASDGKSGTPAPSSKCSGRSRAGTRCTSRSRNTRWTARCSTWKSVLGSNSSSTDAGLRRSRSKSAGIATTSVDRNPGFVFPGQMSAHAHPSTCATAARRPALNCVTLSPSVSNNI